MSRDPFPRDADKSLHLIANALEHLEDVVTAATVRPDGGAPRPSIGWAVLELLGHRREVGHVSDEEIAGARFLRLDTPHFDENGDEDGTERKYFSTAAVYAITPASEQAIRDELAPWVACREPVAVQVEGSGEPEAQPCVLRRGHDGDHDPDPLSDLPF